MKIKDDEVIQLKEVLREVQSACQDFGLHPLEATVKGIGNFTEQNHYLDFAVLGQFKAGKSTFINSLVGRDYLPVGPIPVTSVITRLRYGLQEKAFATFLNGSCQEVDIKDIEQYVSESGNPENRKKVLLVDIETPVLAKIKDVRLVDTPGIGSVWRRNTETTIGWFPETGGVLFLISAERPISEGELSFLQEVYRYSPEIAIVITKIDLFGEAKIKEIESFTAEVLRRIFARDFPILRYSAFQNAVQYNREIKNRILPLLLNRDKVFAEILRHKIATLVESCLSYLEVARQASLKAEAEKAQLKKAVLGEHLNSGFVRRELLLIINSYKENTRENIREYLNAFSHDIEGRLTDEYDGAFTAWQGNLYHVSRKFEDWIKRSLEDQLREIMLEEEKTFELLKAVQKHLSFYLKSFRERINSNLERALGVRMKTENWDIMLREVRKPDISVSRSFDFHLDMLWILFPMFIFRNIFREYFKSQIRKEVEKNLHRLTSRLTERTNKEMDQLAARSLTYINEELQIMEKLLSENRGNSAYITGRMNKIRDLFSSA